MKKFISLSLVIAMLSSNFLFLPAHAEIKFKTRINKEKITDEQRYAYINMEWWKEFNDENLNSYILKALENNNDLKMAKFATEEYYQSMKLQFSKELPQVSTGFAPVYGKLPENSITFNDFDWRFFFPVTVSYEADVFLKNHDKTKSAKKLYEMSLQDERTAYIAVASSVAVLYFNIVKLDDVIETQEKIVNNRKIIYERMQKRNHHGLTSEADTVAAEKAYIQANIELSDMEKSREKLLNQLAVVIGESPCNISEFNRTKLKDLQFAGTIPQEISTEVIMDRPDYKKAELMVKKAGLDVKIAKKEFLPTFNIGGIALFNAGDIGSTFTTASSLLAFGGGVFSPIFTGGARIANLKLRKASYERILENYKKTNLVAMQEINDSLVTIKKDEDKFNKLIKQQQLSKKEHNYNVKREAKGIISNLDLVQSEENVLTIEKIIAIQKAENYINYIGLYKACGGDL